MSCNEIDVKYIFDNLYDYVVIKYRDTLPSYNINEDIDILTSNIQKNINILTDIYDKKNFKHKIISINEYHIQVDLMKNKQRILKFDLYEKFDYKNFSIDENIYRLILKNKIYNDITYIPSLLDDLSLRYCEYIEYKNVEKKRKHLDYVSKFKENFYKVTKGEHKSKLNYFNTSTMYNSIIIWGHGIEHMDYIINSLKDDIDCDILNIKKNSVDNINDFINNCYKLEMKGKNNHIITKTKYLKKVEPSVIHLLIKNYGVKYKKYGSGLFEIISDENIVNWKWKIREKFNPKDKDVNIKPLSKGISHNHVIHITDTEEECNELCKYCLKKLPTKFENFFRTVYIPWHILSSKKKITIDKKNIDDIKVTVIKLGKIKIIDSPVYKYVIGDKQSYIKYWDDNKGTKIQDDHSPNKFDKLINTFKPNQYNYDDKNLIIVSSDLTVLDGHHRISILKHAGINDIKVAIYN
jgi:hypothetical protein